MRPFLSNVIRPLQEHGWRLEVAETVNGRHATQLARLAANENLRAVFAIGGDGTIGQVAAGLVGSQTALGVLPAGTSNVWARELGLPAFTWLNLRALEANARRLAQASVYAIDIGLCNEQPFLMWAGIGLDALTVHKLEPRKRFAKYLATPHYAAATIWNVSLWHGLNLRVWANDRCIEGRFLLAVASNIRHYLGGLTQLSPRACLDDGAMDLWLLSGDDLADAFRHFFNLRAGRHLTSESDQARCVPFQTVRIESDTAFPIQLDGEPMLGTSEANLRVIPKGLRVLLPQEARYLLCLEAAENVS